MYRILLAEDDRMLCRSLTEELQQEGYEVVAVGNGRAAVEMFAQRSFDLVLLDVGMPVMDGLAACREIRRTDLLVPVLFLSAFDDDLTHISGLKAGADDYMDKTISAEEMRLRIRRALLRAHRCEAQLEFRFGEVTVDPEGFSLTTPEATKESLSTREVEILRHLKENRGKTLCWDSLQTKFWGADDEGLPDKVRLAIHRLREKLGASADAIKTVRGVGIVYDD